MKKLIKRLNFAIIGIMASGSAAMAAKGGMNDVLCELAGQFGEIFGLLRTLAFVGAGVTIAGWAWGYISKGEVKFDDLQKKGIGMLVGFFLLFGVGALLSVFMAMTEEGGSLDCVQKFF